MPGNNFLHAMLQAVARLIDSRYVKLLLMAAGLVLTLLFAPMLAAGLVGGALDLRNGYGFLAIACCGLAGMASAWARVLSGVHRLRRSSALRQSIAWGLLLGTGLAIALVASLGLGSGTPVAWVYRPDKSAS